MSQNNEKNDNNTAPKGPADKIKPSMDKGILTISLQKLTRGALLSTAVTVTKKDGGKVKERVVMPLLDDNDVTDYMLEIGDILSSEVLKVLKNIQILEAAEVFVIVRNTAKSSNLQFLTKSILGDEFADNQNIAELIIKGMTNPNKDSGRKLYEDKNIDDDDSLIGKTEIYTK